MKAFLSGSACHCGNRYRQGAGIFQLFAAFIDGAAGGHHIIQQQHTFIENTGRLANGKRSPYVAPSFFHRKLDLRFGLTDS